MGIIGVDYKEVRRSCYDLGIPYTRAIKTKIQAIENVLLERSSRTNEKKDPQDHAGQRAE